MDRCKQVALERLATLEPRELCVEAKLEYCRAARDLRSCGKHVQHLLASCGHTCLCKECSQQCDMCPICRTPLTNPDFPFRLRLYDELVEAGLLSQELDDDIKEREKDGQTLTVHVRRLCAIFDVALENNLVSLVCHYVLEVCMDEGAVSSDALMSMLLGGDVVKDWCRRTAGNVVRSLWGIYTLGLKQLQSKADAMHESLRKLEGVQHVLEALEAPVVDPLSASLLEVQNLLEGVRRVSQHLEVMAWCTRQYFLENLPSRFANISQWGVAVKERKMAAHERTWWYPRNIDDAPKTLGTLFVEDALANLGALKEDEEGGKDALEINRLKRDFVPSSPPYRHRRYGAYPVINGGSTIYPPYNVRATVDMLFLEGSSELILAKKAIFLYYLFDRHWNSSDTSWRNLVDDYVCTFGLSRSFMLESLLFYLLDDNSEQALEEACRLLPEIVTPNIHPKVPRVLLERGRPDVALAVLRSSGRDGQIGVVDKKIQAVAVPLSEAVTALRVRLECGFLTEGYLYQRAHWLRVKSEENRGSNQMFKEEVDGAEPRNWSLELEKLVKEVYWFSIGHNVLKSMMELPWLSDEEAVLKRCLLDQAVQDPTSVAGNFLVMFYVERYRYVEAYLVHKTLCGLEQQHIATFRDEGKRQWLQAACAHRTRIMEACVDLLPQIQQQQLRSGAISNSVFLEENARPSLDQMEVENPDAALQQPMQIVNDRSDSLLFQTPSKKTFGSSFSQQDSLP